MTDPASGCALREAPRGSVGPSLELPLQEDPGWNAESRPSGTGELPLLWLLCLLPGSPQPEGGAHSSPWATLPPVM